MEKNWQNEEVQKGSDLSNVVELAPRKAAIAKALQTDTFLTDAERREIRDMLVFYRRFRPAFEAICKGCPTARHILDELP